MTKMGTIWVSENNKKRLSGVGNSGDSLNDALGKVLDIYEKHIEAQP